MKKRGRRKGGRIDKGGERKKIAKRETGKKERTEGK